MKTFIKAFLTESKRRIFSWSFAIPIIIVTAAYIASEFEELQFMWNADTDVLYFWTIAVSIGYFTPISLLCCTALNCTSFLNDYRSDYYRSSVLRSGKLNYTLSKFLSCVITGGITLFMGVALFVLILSFRFPLIAEDSSYLVLYSDFADTQFPGLLLKDGNYIGFFGVYSLLAFLFGALWSAVGICVSAFITDRYVASFSPYVIWYTLSGILRGKFRTEKVFQGNYNTGGVGGSILFAVVYFGIIIAAMGVIFCIRAGRRCEN